MTRAELEAWRERIRLNPQPADAAVVSAVLWIGSVLLELLEEVRALRTTSEVLAGDAELRCAACGCTEEAACEGGCSWDRERTIALNMPICTNPACVARADQELGRGRVILPG